MKSINIFVSMKNQTYKNRIIYCIIFIVSIILGYIITSNLKSCSTTTPVQDVDTIKTDTIPSDTIPPDTTTEIISEPDNISGTDKPETEPIKPRLTNAQLTSIINNPRVNNYPRGIILKYNNLDTENGEERHTSIANIRQYIATGIWKSVTVTDATFDDKNNVTSITMTIIR